MNGEKLEAFLARLYTDAGFREAFLGDPQAVVARAGLDAEDRDALLRIDREALLLAARSYEYKRARAEPGVRA